MRSDTDHREQLDDFSALMRRKLENHRLPVDDLCWEDIEPRMKSRSRKWLWWATSAVAVIALLFLLPPFRTDDIPGGRPEPLVTTTVNEGKSDRQAPEKRMEEPASPVEQPVGAKRLIAAVASARSSQLQERESPAPSADIQEQEENVQPTDDKKKTDDPGEKKEKVREQPDLYHYESKKYEYASDGKAKKPAGKWSVNAGFGTGGHVSLGLKDAYPMNDYPSSDGPGGGVGGIPPVQPPSFNRPGVLPSEEYTSVDAALPLSFGVTVRKDFNRFIGLETGLVYTYLSSNLSKWDNVRYKSRLELHYLGLPVNLVVSLWQNSRWKIYLSGGVMVEKGIRAKQTETRIWQMEMRNTVDKQGINGLQWSLNASAGVSYRFYKDWNFYFEPRLSHYFDNAQPTSIRTEHSVIVGLGAGIRFDF